MPKNRSYSGHHARRQLVNGFTPPSTEQQAAIARILATAHTRAQQTARSCQGRANCCRFALTGEVPHVTIGETWFAYRAWRATGRTKITLPADGSCPFLNASGACIIYNARPMACRTHFCPHAGGCIPRHTVIDLIHELEDLDTALGGNGSVRLPQAVERLSRLTLGKRPR